MDKSGRAEYQQQYREQHKDAIKQYQKAYREDNKPDRAERKLYADTNKDSRIESQRKYRERNREKIREKDRKYREKNKEKLREYQRERREQIKEGSGMKGNRSMRNEDSRDVSRKSALISWQLRKEAKQLDIKERKRKILEELRLEELRLVEDNKFMLMDVRYKIGSHGFVFYEESHEVWKKSEMTSEELLQRVGESNDEIN